MSGAWVRGECRLSTGTNVVLKYTLSLCQPKRHTPHRDYRVTSEHHRHQCSQRASPSVLKEDRGGRRCVVPSDLFPRLPYHPRPRTRGPAVPRRKCLILAVLVVTYSTTVPSSPPAVPSPPLSSYCARCSSYQSSLTSFLLLFIFIFFLRVVIVPPAVFLMFFLVAFCPLL